MSLSADRMTPERQGDILVIPVAAGVKIFAGSLVMVDAGYAKPAGPTAKGIVAGRAEEFVDNSNGSDGAVKISVKRGVFKFKNSTTDPVTSGNLLGVCYMQDDETVSGSDQSGTLGIAGQIVGIDSDGVWVDTRKA